MNITWLVYEVVIQCWDLSFSFHISSLKMLCWPQVLGGALFYKRYMQLGIFSSYYYFLLLCNLKIVLRWLTLTPVLNAESDFCTLHCRIQPSYCSVHSKLLLLQNSQGRDHNLLFYCTSNHRGEVTELQYKNQWGAVQCKRTLCFDIVFSYQLDG